MDRRDDCNIAHLQTSRAMTLHLDPKVNLGNRLLSPLMLGSAFIVGTGYDGQQLKGILKLYEPLSQRLYLYVDKTEHQPYCIFRTEPLTTENALRYALNVVGEKITGYDIIQKFDAIKDRMTNVIQLVTRVPTDVAGRTDSIREFLKVNEADIRYTDTYIMDTRFEPGMPYSLRNDQLTPTIPQDFPLPTELLNAPNGESQMRRFFRFFEATVPNYRRIAVDIEVYCPSDVHNADSTEAEFPIIACSLSSSDKVNKVLLLRRNKETAEEIIALDRMRDQHDYELFDTEEALIAEIFRYLWTYPFVLTFNGDEYDFRYLYHRAERLGFLRWQIPIEFHQSWMGLCYGVHIDLMRFFANLSLQTYAFGGKYKLSGRTVGLDEVAKGLLGEGKFEHDEQIHDMTPSRLAKYGWKDADLTYRLTSFGNDSVMKLMTILCRVSYQSFEDMSRGGASTWIRNLMFREHRVRNIIIPRAEKDGEGRVVAGDILATKNIISTKSETEGKKFRGAMVVEPEPGLHFNVSVLDFASLYPSIIETWNLGYETVRCEHEDCEKNNPRIVPYTTHWVCKKNRAMTAEIIGTLKDIRVKWYKPKGKDLRLEETLRDYYGIVEQTLKVFMNATYGVFSSDKFSLYCPPMGESVTQVGRYSISKVIERALVMLILVFYGDTDSIFLSLTKDQLRDLIDFAEKELQMKLELDKTYKWVALSGRKKNYVGLKIEKDGSLKFDIKGVTGKKRHTPQFIKEIFQKLLEILKQMDNQEDVPKAKTAIIEMVRCSLDALRAGNIPLKDMVFTVGLQKDPDAYIKNVPMHVKVARTLDGSKAGDVISYVKVKGKENAKHISKAILEEINVPAYVEFLANTLEQVLDCLGMKWEDVDYNDTQTTLFGEKLMHGPKSGKLHRVKVKAKKK